MALMHDLFTLLENKEESFCKRIQIADNAFKSSELLLPHKEFVLIQWILTNSDTCSKEIWDLLYSWICSDQFKQLNRNDISNDEIRTLLEFLKRNLMMDNIESHITNTIIDTSLVLIENVTFQQYFNYNIEMYCQLICSILDKISSLNSLQDLLKSNLFSKTLISEEKFYRSFFDVVLPVFTKILLRFSIPATLFDEVSRVVQKCLFYKNRDMFAIFIKQFFEDITVEKHIVPKILLKSILHFYGENMDTAIIKYKLIFNAFCAEYARDTELIYKFFVLLVHVIGFNLEEKMIFYKISKLNTSNGLSLTKSQEILLNLLDVLSENNNIFDCRVNELTFTEFIRNILKQILFFNTPSNTCYKIFMKAILIDPIVVESITECVIVYAMMTDNRKHQEVYESLIISIFELYSKLHRTENLVAKLVSVLNDSFKKTIASNAVYEFRGDNDIEKPVTETKHLSVENILTRKILDCFSTCICSLASWQVINVLKTLLHYLNKNLDNITNVTNDDFMYIGYMEILSSFLVTFLSSVRIAEHTVAGNVVDKTVKELENLRNMLQVMGMALLNREHNHRLMQCFLNIAYHWAEVYIILAYYSINSEVQLKKSLDNDFTSCNITYLHPYLDVKQWCLIAERITNFGELPCKQLLKKLYIQKLKAMMLFEENVNDDLMSNVVKSITVDLENSWKFILCDKFIVNNLLVKMKSNTLLSIAEIFINNLDSLEDIRKDLHILDVPSFLAGINYICLTKINKLLIKQKRKLNEDTLKIALSSKICSLFTESMLYESDHTELIEKAKEIFHSEYTRQQYEWKINEEKLNNILLVLKMFPVVYGSVNMQKICLIYLCCLHKDLLEEFKGGKYSSLKTNCEDVIIGILQHNKSKILDVLQIDMICTTVIDGYDEWEHIFSLITESVFRDEHYMSKYEPVVTELTDNFKNPKHMRCCFIIINTVNKMKKTKMSKDAKTIAEKYKSMICDKILEVVSENKPDVNLVTGYAYALKTFLSQDEEKLAKLLKNLDSYVVFAAANLENSENYLTLFITILQNQSKLKSLDDNFSLRIWNICKKMKRIGFRFEEYSQLLVLIFGHIPNELFGTVTTDLLKITDNSFVIKDYELLSKHLKTWESVISCNLNPIKTKILTSATESLLQKLIVLLQGSCYEENLYRNVVNLEKILIQTNHLLLTPAVMDMLILTTESIMTKQDQNFQMIFSLVISLLEQLLNYRKPLVMDRLPPYLQQYRLVLKSLCQKSNADLNLQDSAVREISDCAHLFEKLTKNLVSCQKDMGRIGMYLIADILEQYEQISLHPTVKIHLNNCIYSFISISDQHAVTYLMRVLSNASTEIFKIMFNNYKKYYRFTGKI